MSRDLVSRLNNLREEFFYPLESQFNKFFDEFFSNDFGVNMIKGRSNYPKLDVMTADGKWVVEVHIPGIDGKDLEVEILPQKSHDSQGVTIEERLLKISGRQSDEQYDKGAT